MSGLPPLELLNLQETAEDKSFTYQPTSFDQYLGQKELKEKLKVYTQACKLRDEPLDHLLLFGPPGLGKTTLAKVMAKELEVPVKVTSAPVLERSGDLVAILSNLASKEILFIDEIHRLPKIVEEILYSAMENFCVDMIVGQGAGAKSIRLPLNPFTLIGVTTKTALLSGPLQTRFGIVERLDFYMPEDLAAIVTQNAEFLKISILPESALSTFSCADGSSRGSIPRSARCRCSDLIRIRSLGRVPGANDPDESPTNTVSSSLVLPWAVTFSSSPFS